VIQSVDAAPIAGGAGSGLTVHANGPLPVPTVGVLDGPPRIYLDFAGVRLPSGITAEFEHPMLRGVRLAQHTLDPLVARIVLDLITPVEHRIDTRARQAGRVVVLLGEETRDLAAPTDKPARATDSERYLSRISPLLVRLHALRRVVGAVDGAVGGLSPEAAAAADELDTLGRAVAAITVPESLATTKDLLLRYCALGSRAIRMRNDSAATGDAAAARNAGSAAAGALIVLDRASRDLGYIPPP
jgi:AMIN domain